MPPYLAGREDEQSLFRALLDRLRNRSPLPSEVILYGPRGNGKTVLLGWLREEAASTAGVSAVSLRPSEVLTPETLAATLRRRRWWDWAVPGQLGLGGVSWAGRPGDVSPSSLAIDLLARTEETGLLLVVDEAHTLSPSVGRVLLNAAQEVRQRHPLLVMLAGTPDIEGHLARMGAPFWNRARQIRVGRLDDGATADAFRLPFEAEGVSVEGEVLPEVVRLSHGYPYFIQLLGAAAWEAACDRGGSTPVTLAVLSEALSAFEATKGHYYRHRYMELRDRRLLGVARSVALAFAGRDRVSDQEMTLAVRSGLDDPSHEEAIRAERILSDLGFIWGATPGPDWEPGIPSLMDYIVEHAPAP